MKRLLNQISERSEVGQLKCLISMISKMMCCKTTYEELISMNAQSSPETPKATALCIMGCIQESELRDKVYNKKNEPEDDLQSDLAQQWE